MWSLKAETPEVVVELVEVGMVQPALAAEQRPRRIGRRARLAERRSPRPARLAIAAGGDKGQDHVVAGVEGRRPRTDPDHLAGRLVAERHRHHPRARAVDHREVGVTEAGGPDLDQQLARSRRIELDLGDLQRPRLGVGPRCSHLAQERGADLHPGSPATPAGTSRSRLARSRSGIGAGRRPATSTKTWTNQPVAAGSAAPLANRPIS